jgi:hypothetical protein
VVFVKFKVGSLFSFVLFSRKKQKKTVMIFFDDESTAGLELMKKAKKEVLEEKREKKKKILSLTILFEAFFCLKSVSMGAPYIKTFIQVMWHSLYVTTLGQR